MLTGVYSFEIASCIVEADVVNVSEREQLIKIKEVSKFNINNGEYVGVTCSPKDVEWFERQVALKLYSMWSN